MNTDINVSEMYREITPRRLTVRGVTYEVRIFGRGKPLLLLHGFTGSSKTWTWFQRHLHNLECIAVDLLGHGGTDAPEKPARYAMEESTDDLVELMSALGHRQFSCLGYSMGGRLALGLVGRYPDVINRLVLESASPGLATEAERLCRRKNDEVLASKIETDGVDAFIRDWERIPLFATQSMADPLRLEQQRAIRRAGRPEGLAGSLRGFGTGSQPSLWDKLADVRCPTLIIAGLLDDKFTDIAKRMACEMGVSRLALVNQAGHTVHLEQPDEYVRLVQRFLDS